MKCLASRAGVTARLWRARWRGKLSSRSPFLLLVITAFYGYSTSTAFTASSSLVGQSDPATLVFVFFGVGIARTWEPLGLRGGGLLDLLTTCGSGARQPGGASAGPAGAPGADP